MRTMLSYETPFNTSRGAEVGQYSTWCLLLQKLVQLLEFTFCPNEAGAMVERVGHSGRRNGKVLLEKLRSSSQTQALCVLLSLLMTQICKCRTLVQWAYEVSQS